MKRLICALLFLPLPVFGSIRSYTNGFSDFWCDEYKCYGLASTKIDQAMSGHKYQAYAQIEAPDGSWQWADTGLVNTNPIARVGLSHKNFVLKGEWKLSGNTGRRTCPWGQPKNAQYFMRGKKIGTSIICMTRGPVWSACKPIYTLGIQTNWSCTYFPIATCNVKCKVEMYTIIIVGGAGTTPAYSGEVVKGWEQDIDNNTLKCTPGFVMQFYPTPCSSCKEKTIFDGKI